MSLNVNNKSAQQPEIKNKVDFVKEKAEESKQKVVEAVERTKENVKAMAQGTPAREGDFDQAIAKGATEIQPDMEALHTLDAKYQLDADIHTVKRVPFDVAIERGAAQVQTSNNIEAKKEGVFNALDKGAEKLKQGVETVADKTKSAAHQAQENLDEAKDRTRENVDWAKEKVQSNAELLKERTQEVVQKVQGGVDALGGKIGVSQPSDFKSEIAVGANQMRATIDVEALRELDRKY
jgi:ElaB/YqjD/DUF883 family membrane-anchored ribosome-binding protein